MKESDFTSGMSGRLVKSAGGYLAFVPNPLPPAIAWDEELAARLADATLALGRLLQATERVGSVSSELLVSGIAGVLARKEAVLSSMIEGTHTTLSELLRMEAEPKKAARTDERQEVLNYVHALDHGMARLSSLPLSKRLLRELHAQLMQGARGKDKTPGELRRHQVHLGAEGSPAGEASYVPPPWKEVEPCLDELEKYIEQSRTDRTHALVRVALVHYQFEAIHPFLDGNGRIGRLLITLQLIDYGLMHKPVIYLSKYFERHRAEYYRRLKEVSTEGAWRAWLAFFLEGIRVQADESVNRCERLLALYQAYIERLQSVNARAGILRVITNLFEYPFITIQQVQAKQDVSPMTANRYVKQLTEMGILVKATTSRRNQIFVASEILNEIED